MIHRRVLGTILGLVTSTFTIAAIEYGGGYALGPVKLAGGDGAVEAMFLVVIAAWTIGALLGGIVAAALTQWSWAPWIVGGLVVVGVIVNAASFPHPWWMILAGIVLPLLAARLAASRVAAPQRVAL